MKGLPCRLDILWAAQSWNNHHKDPRIIAFDNELECVDVEKVDFNWNGLPCLIRLNKCHICEACLGGLENHRRRRSRLLRCLLRNEIDTLDPNSQRVWITRRVPASVKFNARNITWIPWLPDNQT